VIFADGQFHPTGTYTAAQPVQVEIQSTYRNTTLLYTLHGELPERGAFYTEPFIVDASVTVRAIAYNGDYSQSFEATPLTIAIHSAPSIMTMPQSQEAILGSDVTFSVSASGTEPVFYQWFFNGSPVNSDSGASLVRTGVQPADAGGCWVVLANSFGSATSAVASLTLLFPPGLSAQPLSTNVSPGQS